MLTRTEIFAQCKLAEENKNIGVQRLCYMALALLDVAELVPDGESEEGTCVKCHVAMGIDDGCEPTAICHHCAQALVERVRTVLREGYDSSIDRTWKRLGSWASGSDLLHEAVGRVVDRVAGLEGELHERVEQIRGSVEREARLEEQFKQLTSERDEAVADIKRVAKVGDDNLVLATRMTSESNERNRDLRAKLVALADAADRSLKMRGSMGAAIADKALEDEVAEARKATGQ